MKGFFMNNSNILFSSEYLEDCEIAVGFEKMLPYPKLLGNESNELAELGTNLEKMMFFSVFMIFRNFLALVLINLKKKVS